MNTSRAIFGLASVLALGLGAALARPSSGDASDETAIKAQTKAFSDAWAKHDPKALAACWAEDGDLLNPWGRLATGRSEVEKLFTDEQTGNGPLAASTLELKSETVRSISSDVALDDWEIVVTGGKSPDGGAGGPMSFHCAVVLKKVGGQWLIAAGRPYLKAPPMATSVK